MEALQASLAEAKKNRSEDATVHDITPTKKTAKKAASKKHWRRSRLPVTPPHLPALPVHAARPRPAKEKVDADREKTAKKAAAKKTAARKRSA